MSKKRVVKFLSKDMNEAMTKFKKEMNIGLPKEITVHPETLMQTTCALEDLEDDGFVTVYPEVNTNEKS